MTNNLIPTLEGEYPEQLIQSCRETPFGFCRLQGEGKNLVVKKSMVKSENYEAVLEDICMLEEFTYCVETKQGHVSALLNLVEEAIEVTMRGTVYDEKHKTEVKKLPMKTYDRGRMIYEWAEGFELAQAIPPEDLAVLIDAQWMGKDGQENHLVLLHENVVGTLDFEYRHIYPQKEKEMVKVEVKDGSWADQGKADKATGSQKNIVICFNRMPGYMADVDYLLMVKSSNLGKPMFSVPGRGIISVDGASIVLNDPKYPCTATCLVTRVNGGGGTGERYDMEYPTQVFSKKGRDLSYDICLSWNEEFQGQAGQMPNVYDYNLSITAYFQSESMTVPQPVKVRVTSLDVKPGPREVLHKLEHLQIMWGCMAEGTRIRMADGSMKQVQDVRIGDRLSDKHGCPVVENMWIGKESTMIEITCVTGDQILLTTNHPILCDKGWVGAAIIRAGIRVMTESGNYVEIKCVKKILGDFTVYNVDLDSMEHSLYAEGFVVGDNYKQNMLYLQG